MTDPETARAIKANSEQPKLHLICPNEDCGKTGRILRTSGVLAGGKMRGREERIAKRWTIRPEVEATDDPVIHMSVPRERLCCPSCGTRGYIP